MPDAPVAADQLVDAVVKAIVREFAGRALDIDTARHGVALAAEQLVTACMREVGKRPPSAQGRPALSAR